VPGRTSVTPVTSCIRQQPALTPSRAGDISSRAREPAGQVTAGGQARPAQPVLADVTGVEGVPGTPAGRRTRRAISIASSGVRAARRIESIPYTPPPPNGIGRFGQFGGIDRSMATVRRTAVGTDPADLRRGGCMRERS
jgi:hypothetical protein